MVSALLKMSIRVFYVTHLFALAESLCHSELDSTLFLRAERLEDSRRTFRLLEGAPLPTGFGEDLYRRILETLS